MDGYVSYVCGFFSSGFRPTFPVDFFATDCYIKCKCCGPLWATIAKVKVCEMVLLDLDHGCLKHRSHGTVTYGHVFSAT